MAKLRVGLIFGGRSGEHEVSIVSARSIFRAIDKEKYEVVPLAITKAGEWLSPEDSGHLLQADSEAAGARAEAGTQSHPDLTAFFAAARGIDVAFPVVHGTYGEDGTIQGLLELVDIPYVGAGVAASALGMDKSLQKVLLRQRGLPVADCVVILRADWEREPSAQIRRIEEALPYPCFVKPAGCGSSLGVTKVRSREALSPALDEAFLYDRKAMAEMAIEGRELECSVLGNDEPAASPVGEVIPAREFYDYEAKYSDTRTKLIVPTALDPDIEREIRRLAIEAFRAIDGAGMARVDFFLSGKDNSIYINEVNTIPGFTHVSMYPKMWEAGGLSYPQLIDRLIELASERHRDIARRRLER